MPAFAAAPSTPNIDTRFGLPHPMTGDLVPARGVPVHHQNEDTLTLSARIGCGVFTSSNGSNHIEAVQALNLHIAVPLRKDGFAF